MNNLEPIIVHPTNEQISNATENLIFSNIINPINTQCPISLEQFTNSSSVTMIKHCKHIFNTTNLMNWFTTNCKCPVCRFDIRDYVNKDASESDLASEHDSESENENETFNNTTPATLQVPSPTPATLQVPSPTPSSVPITLNNINQLPLLINRNVSNIQSLINNIQTLSEQSDIDINNTQQILSDFMNIFNNVQH